MKSIVRWSMTLGLVGTTLIGSLFLMSSTTLALSEKQVTQKLDAVPVYLITNEKGSPLTRTLPDNPKNGQKGGSYTGVYMSRGEALKVVNQLKSEAGKNPKFEEIAKNLQVSVVPLGVIYQQVEQTRNVPNHLGYLFKPVDDDIKGALDLLHKSGQNLNTFPSVPIFAVRFAPNKGYVQLKYANEKTNYIPLFLSEQDAKGLLSQVKPKFPDADIQVIDVDHVIKTLKDKNDDWLKQVVIIPSKESREYINTLPSNRAATGNSTSVKSK